MKLPRRHARLNATRALILFSVLAHVALAGWHAGAMAAVRGDSAIAVETVTICAGGVLKQISVNADGVPVSGEVPTLATSCPLCAVVGSSDDIARFDLHWIDAERVAVAERHGTGVEQRYDREPLVQRGQDPPYSS